MRKVTNESFFHFSKLTDYQIGKSYFFGDRVNEFFGFYEQYEPINTADQKTILTEYTTYVRECIFEEVRKQEFPDCPSRTKCIWLMPPSFASLRFWHSRIPEADSLIKFSCSGVVHEADERFLHPLYFNLALQRKLARLYWSGDSVLEDASRREVLFTGMATAVKIFPLQPGNCNLPDPSDLGLCKTIEEF